LSGALTRPKGRTLPALSVLFPMWAGVAGAGATLALVHGSRLRPPWDRTILLVAIAWVGTAVAFGSGLAELALAPPDRLAPGTSVTLAAGSLSGLIMAVAAYRRVTRPAADEHTRTTAGTGSST
jgi:hypothetical protein